MLLNREKLSELLGCSLRTVDEYRRQGMPGAAPAKPGGQWRFESAEVISWLRTRERDNAIGEIAGIDEGEAKRRKLAAEAAIAEHSLAVLQSSAVSVADWQAATFKIVGATRAKLLPIGSSLASDLAIETDPDVCEALVSSAINEALQELSEDDIQIDAGGDNGAEPSDPPEPEAVGSTPGRDGKRVGGPRAAAELRHKR